jgi:hypothetical protein
MTLLALALAAALQAEPACPAKPAEPPVIFGGWTARAPLKLGTGAGDTPKVETGNGFDATLSKTVTFELKPEKAGDADSYGGMIEIQIDRTGVLAVGLSSGAWVDLVQGGAAVKADAFGHGPACTGIVKQLRFPVGQGQYILQISNSKTPTISLVLGEE